MDTGATTRIANLPGQLAWGIAVTPDGSSAYAASSNYPYDEGYISSIDLDTHAVQTVVDLPGSFFLGVAITSDGQQVYSGDVRNASLLAINTSSGGYRIIPIGVAGTDLLGSVAITPDGKDVYLTNGVPGWSPAQGVVSILFHYSRETELVSSETITQQDAMVFSLAITPDQAPTARFAVTVSGLSVQFDASSSTTPTGSIKSYQWDFGDGQSETTASPTVTHTYSSAGPKTVTLTVTNTAGTSTEVTFTGQTVSNNGGPSAVTQQNVDIPAVLAPRHFRGEPKIYHHEHKIKIDTTWDKSKTHGVKRYEIFAHDKQIAKISVKHDRRKTLHLHPRHVPSHISKEYRKYLHHKYKIRAVTKLRQPSPFTHLHVEH